ncbi:hypothetical protein AUEXF2481DRAFT_629765 [Aureobasidium subglaciale EXF-2481]|uniref:Uncharacterized protein n=1 Tax=Aureobasidium subglaciale (strain EXF-2481) TaxID=1043005 RepID=A0A074YSK6_AURSE|nr:uncharacterized protein AUEXF2481DRAFT_629765 [Aureobasidium subglaciale EXF-2481]KEQ97087.1 hypothetical protein AUEXF2481DRAFT_629765 [Aureobasidium subglaciale EXF-2481]
MKWLMVYRLLLSSVAAKLSAAVVADSSLFSSAIPFGKVVLVLFLLIFAFSFLLLFLFFSVFDFFFLSHVDGNWGDRSLCIQFGIMATGMVTFDG